MRYLVLLVATVAACDPGSEDAFTQGRAYDSCVQSINACPGQTATCVLDDKRFARTQFPGSINFMVEADPDSQIEVLIYLSDQRDAGFSTRIYWYEPGCSDVYVYDSAGRDLFEEAEETHIIQKKEKIYEGGEHLIEINSDMQAKVVIAVNVIEPES